MRITDFVSPGAVLFRLRSERRDGVIDELARGLAAAYPGLDEVRVRAALEERERLGTTGIGHGVAVPHGKVLEAKAVVGMLALSSQGVEVAAPDRRPARIFVAVLSPARQRTAHLEAMATIARELASSRLRKRLLAAADGTEVYGVLSDAAFIAGH
jgi:PTS system nitrogen regulatory IIA component